MKQAGSNSERVHRHLPSYKLKYRNHSPEVLRTRPIQKQCYACMDINYDGSWMTWRILQHSTGQTIHLAAAPDFGRQIVSLGKQSYR